MTKYKCCQYIEGDALELKISGQHTKNHRPNIVHQLFLCELRGFTFYMVKKKSKEEEYFVTCDSYMKLIFQ